MSVCILLVEDDAVEVMAIERALKPHPGLRPLFVANDGQQALDLLRGRHAAPIPRPGLILLDLNLPGMNGIELLGELRADPALVSSLVLVMSTSSDERDKAAAYRAGAAAYIVKEKAGKDFSKLTALLDAYLNVVEFS